MSAPVAFSALITAVQLRANIDNQAGPVTLPEIRGYLNEGLAEYWDLLVEGRGQEFIRKQQVISTTAGTSAYSLASDFYELISVDLQVTPTQFLSMTPYMEHERNLFRQWPTPSAWFLGMPLFYRILGSTGVGNVAFVVEKQINFIPTLQQAYSVNVNYIYRLPPFDVAGSQDANLIDAINNWTDFAIWQAVACVKHRLREDPSFALSRVESLKSRIEALAPMNDAGNAERIRDVNVSYDFPWWR
jgi:hypothetical protein